MLRAERAASRRFRRHVHRRDHIEPCKESIDADSFSFAGLDQFIGWDADLGYQFENLVVNNFRELLPSLHLEKVMIKSAADGKEQTKLVELK